MNFYIYQHIRLDTNKVFYIGIGSKYRSNSKTGRTQKWKNIVNKVGYRIEILSDNLSYENAQEAEIRLIELYGREDLNTGILINKTKGGSGNFGLVTSDLTKQKQRLAKLGKIASVSTRLKMSDSRRKDKCYRARKIINIENNTIYNCIQDAAEDNNIKYSTLKCYLCGSNKNKTSLRYYE